MATTIATEFPQIGPLEALNMGWREKELYMGMLSARNQHEKEMLDRRREQEREEAMENGDYDLPQGTHPSKHGARPPSGGASGSASGGGDWSTPHPHLRGYENVRAGTYSKGGRPGE